MDDFLFHTGRFIFGFLLGVCVTGIGFQIGDRRYTKEEFIDEMTDSIETYRDEHQSCYICRQPWPTTSEGHMEKINVDSS